MPPKIKDALAKFTGGAGSFTVAQKTIAAIGAAVLIMGGIFLYQFMTKPSMTPIFSGLSSEDANAVVEQLRSDGVSYEITGGGNTILVPEESVYEERMKAASAGIPSNKTGGYSLLDDMGVTSSEFQQDATYKRALEGELAKTIGALDGVRTASVQLALPESTVFVAEKADPTASVFVEAASGKTISDDQVQAIVHLTSASIDGLDAENVAVIDSKGTVLSAVGVGATGSADKQASDYETRVASAVQAMLDRVLGSGNATVAVAADMSYESGNRTAETFTSAGDVPALSEETATEQYAGGADGGTAAGVLGPDNIAVPGGADGDGSYSSESSTKNNAVNKVTETTAIPAGTLNRQTVSVAVSRDAAGGLDQEALMGLVSNAAGINEERGDAVSLEVLPFNNGDARAAQDALAAADAEKKAAEKAAMIQNIMIAASVIVLIIIALVIFALRNRRMKRQAIDLGMDPIDLGELDPPTIAVSAVELEPTPITNSIPVIAPPVPADNGPALMREQVTALAVAEPEKTAEYLRALMDKRTTV